MKMLGVVVQLVVRRVCIAATVVRDHATPNAGIAQLAERGAEASEAVVRFYAPAEQAGYV